MPHAYSKDARAGRSRFVIPRVAGESFFFFCPARLPRVEIRAIMWESAKEEKDVREWKAVAPGPYVRCMLDSRRDELSAR